MYLHGNWITSETFSTENVFTSQHGPLLSLKYTENITRQKLDYRV